MRLTILNGLKCQAVDKKIEQIMSVGKQTNEVTTKDSITNKCIRGSAGVASIVNKLKKIY